jgi:hypothetical protein
MRQRPIAKKSQNAAEQDASHHDARGSSDATVHGSGVGSRRHVAMVDGLQRAD